MPDADWTRHARIASAARKFETFLWKLNLLKLVISCNAYSQGFQH